MILLLISLKGVLAFIGTAVVVVVAVAVLGLVLRLVELFFKGRLQAEARRSICGFALHCASPPCAADDAH